MDHRNITPEPVELVGGIDPILRRPAVELATGLVGTSLDREITRGNFPRGIKLSSDPRSRAVGWPASKVRAWIESRKADSERAP